jgi:hypothetical protein
VSVRHRIAGLLLLAGLGAPRLARADTEEGFYYSDDAALVAGAVVAWTRDAGAIWYNPAGLGGLVRPQLSLNGSAYALKIRKTPDALQTAFPGIGPRSIDISSTDIMSTPHATAFVRSLNDKVSAGFGIYVTQRDVRTATNTLQLFAPSSPDLPFDANLRQHLDTAFDLTKYEAGPAIGVQLSSKFRFGANLFGTYTKRTGLAVFEVDAAGTQGTPPPAAYELSSQHGTISEIGIVGSIGVQWNPNAIVQIGATIRTPELRLHQSLDGVGIDATASNTPPKPSAVMTFDDAGEAGGIGRSVPPRAVLGIGLSPSDRVQISFEGDILPAMDSGATGVTTRTVFNIRAGVRVTLTDTLRAGIGAFTDRDRNVLGDSLTDERIDRVGATAGIQLLTPFDISTESGPKASGLILATTLALRYAAGFGEVRALDLDPIKNTQGTRTVDVLFHEFSPYLGSAVSF